MNALRAEVLGGDEEKPTPRRVGRPLFGPDPKDSASLPAHYYYSPEIFEREKEEIWFKTWQFVGLAQDLEEPGSYITATIVDQQIFVVRGRDGALRAFYNVCTHRGHTLLSGKGRCALVVCPFHAWSFNFDGTLNKAPYSENVLTFEPKDYPLSSIQVDTLGFMVFVNLDPNALSLQYYTGNLLQEMREYVPGFDGQRLVRKDELPLDANWKFILDGLESYHTPIIHPQVMSGKNAYVTKDIVITTDEYYSTHITKGNYELLENHKDRLPYPMDDLAVKDILIWFLWPNLVFVSRQGPSNFQILQATPQAPNRSVRYAINLCLREEPNEFDFAHMNTYRDVIWPQDRQAMEQQQAGVVSRGYTQGRLLADAAQSWWSEHATHHFEHLVWTALNGNDYREELNRP